MSFLSRFRTRARSAAPAVPQPKSFCGEGGAFESARRSGFRGFFFFPGLEPSAQMPQWTRQIISEKINWLYNNVGAVRAVVDGLSLDEVDTGIWPKAIARNAAEFNNAATDRFHETWKDPRFFDSRGVENAYSAQFLIRRHIRLHGELFGQMLRPIEGSPYARIHFIPSWQVKWPSTLKPDETGQWEDGVRSDAFGSPIEYRVITNRAESTWIDVPASDMLHFHDAFWVGQKRGISELAPVARKLFTVDDIEKALANGVQLRAQIAYAIERKEGDTGGPTLFPGAVETQEIPIEASSDDATPAKLLVQKLVSPAGNETTIAEPPAGRTIKLLESSQHLVEPLGLKLDVLRDVALCAKYPPEYVFSLAGLTQGTLVRLTMRRVQIVKNTVRQFQIIPQFLEPLYRFRLWQDIKRGLYDSVGVPTDWWRVKMICPADTTVDIGREGRLFDERVATGKMSPEAYHGINGDDASDVEDEVIATRERREAKLKEVNTRRTAAKLDPLQYEDLWPANTTQATAMIQAGANPEPAEP